MNDIRKTLEAMDKFAGEPEQKPGDQVRGTDKAKKSDKHPFLKRLVGEAQATESLRSLKKQFAEFKTQMSEQMMSNTMALDSSVTQPGAQPQSPSAMAQMKAQQLKQVADQKKQIQDQIKQTTDQLTQLKKQLADLNNPANIAMESQQKSRRT